MAPSKTPQLSLIDIRLHPAADEATLRNLASGIWQNAGRAESAGGSFVKVRYGCEPDNSRYFLIVLEDGCVAGVIGHFEFTDNDRVAGLTWSGLLPEFRGRGIYRAALMLLIEEVKSAFPKAAHIEEIVPAGPRHDEVVNTFGSLGFEFRGKHHDESPLFDGGSKLWLPIPGRAKPRWQCRGKFMYDSWAPGPPPPLMLSSKEHPAE